MTGIGRLLTHRRTVLLGQIVIGLVFLAAALAKIGDASSFALQIRHYRLVPFGLENLLAVTLPWIELLAALAILLRLHPRAGSAVGAGFMVLYVVVVAVAVARGLDIECGCFGTADAGRVGVAKLLENVGLLAVSVLGCMKPR